MQSEILKWKHFYMNKNYFMLKNLHYSEEKILAYYKDRLQGFDETFPLFKEGELKRNRLMLMKGLQMAIKEIEKNNSEKQLTMW